MAKRSSIAGSTPWGPLFCAIPDGPIVDVFVAPGAANASNDNKGDDPAFPLATLGEFQRRASRLARMDASLRVHLESGVHPWNARGLQAIAMKVGCYLAIIGDGADQPGDDGTTNIIAPSAAAGGSSAMQVVTAGLTVDALVGHFIEILTGPAAGDRRLIRSNTTTQIVPAYRFSAAVAATNQFRVFKPAAILDLPGWSYNSLVPPSLDAQGFIARDCGGPVSSGGVEFASSGVLLATTLVRGASETSTFFGAQRSSLLCYGTQIEQPDATGDIQVVGDPATRFSCGTDSGYRDFALGALAPVALGLADGAESWLGYGLGARNPGASGGLPMNPGNMIGFVGARNYSVQFNGTNLYWFGGGFVDTAGFSALDIGKQCYVETGLSEDSTITPRPLVHNKFNHAEAASLTVFGGSLFNGFRLHVQKTNQGCGVLVGSFDEGQSGGLPGQCNLKGGQSNPLFLGVTVEGITAAGAPTLGIVAVAGGVITTLGETGSGGPPETPGWPADSELAVLFMHKSPLSSGLVQKLDFDDALVNFDGATMPTPDALGPDTELAGGRYGYIRLLG